MISTHSRYSFHTYGDGKDSTLNDIDDHRVRVDGHYYWVMRINPQDAAERKVRHHELIRVYNDRGSVICAADVSPMIAPGVCKAYESSAEVDLFMDPRFGRVDRGGCVNLLTPRRPQVKHTDGMGSNSCLVNFEPYQLPAEELLRA
nr:molybdopterin dinucleotide binding domain-containing protein [Burkholderia multivorans]